MPHNSTDEDVKQFLEKPEIEKMMLELVYLAKLERIASRLPTLADMEVFYPRLGEKIVFSSCLRQQAIRYIRRNQQNPFVVRCPTCKQEADRFDFIQIQG
jgi:hypothetical protein